MASPVDAVRVFIVADDPLARTGLAALLAGQSGCAVVGQAPGDADLLAAAQESRPDVLLWDLGWHPEDGLAYLADLRDFDLPVTVLLPDGGPAAEALAAGARGVLPRRAGPAAVAAALAAVAAGLTVVDPVLAGTLFPDRERPAPAPLEELTPRERAVLQILAEGLSNKAIAGRLGISEHTVKFHVTAIMGKLGAQTRTEAVTRAARLGLIVL